MIRKPDQRQAKGKRTEWKFHGRPVGEEKLQRLRKRFEKELAVHCLSLVPRKLPLLPNFHPNPNILASSNPNFINLCVQTSTGSLRAYIERIMCSICLFD